MDLCSVWRLIDKIFYFAYFYLITKYNICKYIFVFSAAFNALLHLYSNPFDIFGIASHLFQYTALQNNVKNRYGTLAL